VAGCSKVANGYRARLQPVRELRLSRNA
jgi:hypothetical protein